MKRGELKEGRTTGRSESRKVQESKRERAQCTARIPKSLNDTDEAKLPIFCVRCFSLIQMFPGCQAMWGVRNKGIL